MTPAPDVPFFRGLCVGLLLVIPAFWLPVGLAVWAVVS